MPDIYTPPDESFVRKTADLERRTKTLERMPSGLKSIGPPHLAIVPSAVVNTLAVQTTAGSVQAVMLWTNKVRDNQAIYNAASNTRLTIPIAGIYLVEVGIDWNTNATGYRHIQLWLNNATVVREMLSAPSPTTDTTEALVVTTQLVVGDFMEVRVRQGSGGNLDVLNGPNTFFGVTWLGNG